MVLLPGCKCCGPCWRCYSDGTDFECVGPEDTAPDGWLPVGKCHPSQGKCEAVCPCWKCYERYDLPESCGDVPPDLQCCDGAKPSPVLLLTIGTATYDESLTDDQVAANGAVGETNILNDFKNTLNAVCNTTFRLPWSNRYQCWGTEFGYFDSSFGGGVRPNINVRVTCAGGVFVEFYVYTWEDPHGAFVWYPPGTPEGKTLMLTKFNNYDPTSGLDCSLLDNPSVTQVVPKIFVDPDGRGLYPPDSNLAYAHAWYGFMNAPSIYQNSRAGRAEIDIVEVAFDTSTLPDSPTIGTCCTPTGDCTDTTFQECEDQCGIWTPDATCEDNPCEPAEAEEYKCFDAQPDEEGWVATGDCHASEEECAESCGPWKCYGKYDLPDNCEIVPDNCLCPDGKQAIWPDYVTGNLSHGPFSLDSSEGLPADESKVQQFLDFFSSNLQINSFGPTNSVRSYNKEFPLWSWSGGVNVSFVAIAFNACSPYSVSFAGQSGITLKQEYFPDDPLAIPGSGTITLQINAKQEGLFYEKCQDTDVGEFDYKLLPSLGPSLLSVVWYTQTPTGIKINSSTYSIENPTYNFNVKVHYDDAVLGTCCLPTGGCSITTHQECADQCGIWTPDATCEDNPCEPAEAKAYQCFDAQPDEEGWVVTGDGHPDETSCAEDCPPEDPTTPPGARTMTTTKTTGGPGTELSKLLRMIGINAKEKGCGCKSHSKRMDREGPQWCRDNIETILGWLQTEAKKRKLPFVKAAAKQVVLLAIRRADIRK